MFDYQGCKCPVCQQPFAESDDIVVCPDCGAPYHRGCYQKNAGCLFAGRHAPGFEWKPAPGECPAAEAPQAPGAAPDTPEIACAACGAMNPVAGLFCETCGAPLHKGAPRYDPTSAERSPAAYGPASAPPADPFQMDAVPPEFRVRPDEEIDGISARDWAAYLGKNASYYLLNFKRISATGRKMSLCFSAFLFGPLYFFYRKMWVPALAYLAMDAVIYLPAILNLMIYAENPLVAGLSAQALPALYTVSSVLVWVLKFLSGSFAVWIYKNTAAKRIRAARSSGPASGPALAKAGGTSTVALVLVVVFELVVTYAAMAFAVWPILGTLMGQAGTLV